MADGPVVDSLVVDQVDSFLNMPQVAGIPVPESNKVLRRTGAQGSHSTITGNRLKVLVALTRTIPTW